MVAMVATLPLPGPLSIETLLLRHPDKGRSPFRVRFGTWGCPIEEAEHALIYFGGMGSSLEEPALHSWASEEADIYRERKAFLVAIEKPGIGGSDLIWNWRLRDHWPYIVSEVATHLGLERYGVFGVSNGGPYVMACLTGPDRERIGAAAMISAQGDTWASGHFSCRFPSRVLEGLLYSLPIVILGPLLWAIFVLVTAVIFKSCCKFSPVQRGEVRHLFQRMLADARRNFCLGTAMQAQVASPFFQRKRGTAESDFAGVTQHVSLWYGLSDFLVPAKNGRWLAEVLPKRTEHFVPKAGHDLFFSVAKDVVDELLANMHEVEGQILI